MFRGRLAAAALLALAGTGCFVPLAREFAQAPDYDAHGITNVAVMPAANEELDLEAPAVVALLTHERLAQRGYVVLPRDEVETKLGALGIHDGGALGHGNRDTHKKLCEATGAHALLYPTIHEWNTVTLGVYNEIAVEVSYRLIACDTQKEVWTARDNRKHNTVDINPARMVFQTLSTAQQPYTVVAEEVVYNCIDSLPDGPRS